MAWLKHGAPPRRVLLGGLLALALASSASGQGEVCSPAMEVEIATTAAREPPLPGVFPGTERPKLILAQDIDWPPYAYLGVPPESDFDVAGFGHDVAHGMGDLCGIDITTVQTAWDDCWNAGKIGDKLASGHFHACMTFTHTMGQRNRFVEFSWGILQSNKPAGLLARVSNGVPEVNGMSDLSGKTIVDVVGWAPTSDTLAMVENKCTKQRFATDFTMLTPETPKGQNPNDVALKMLLNGTADAMWVYADQAKNYQCVEGVTPEWDCDMWARWKTDFAYIQTGLYGHVYNGTTLTLSKKGSGVRDIVNPCLQKFMETKAYYDICVKHDLVAACYPNAHFPASEASGYTHEKPTSELTTTCADGYCPCPSG